MAVRGSGGGGGLLLAAVLGLHVIVVGALLWLWLWRRGLRPLDGGLGDVDGGVGLGSVLLLPVDLEVGGEHAQVEVGHAQATFALQEFLHIGERHALVQLLHDDAVAFFVRHDGSMPLWKGCWAGRHVGGSPRGLVMRWGSPAPQTRGRLAAAAACPWRFSRSSGS